LYYYYTIYCHILSPKITPICETGELVAAIAVFLALKETAEMNKRIGLKHDDADAVRRVVFSIYVNVRCLRTPYEPFFPQKSGVSCQSINFGERGHFPGIGD
jgi:hypothetical protein